MIFELCYIEAIIQIESADRLGTVRLLYLHKLAERSHTRRGAGEDAVERLGRYTILRVGLQHHTIEFGEAVEVADVGPTIITCQGGEHSIGSRSGTLALPQRNTEGNSR